MHSDRRNICVGLYTTAPHLHNTDAAAWVRTGGLGIAHNVVVFGAHWFRDGAADASVEELIGICVNSAIILFEPPTSADFVL